MGAVTRLNALPDNHVDGVLAEHFDHLVNRSAVPQIGISHTERFQEPPHIGRCHGLGRIGRLQAIDHLGGTSLPFSRVAMNLGQLPVLVAQCGEQGRVGFPASVQRCREFITLGHRDAGMDGGKDCRARLLVQPVAKTVEARACLGPEPQPISGRRRERHRPKARDMALAHPGAAACGLDDADVQPMADLSEAGEHCSGIIDRTTLRCHGKEATTGDHGMAAGINWQKEAEMDPTIQQMLEEGVPMTRDNYIEAYFEGEVPEDFDEADLPAAFHLFNQRHA